LTTRLGGPRGSAPREDRLDDVLAVAAELFRARGYRATTLEEIADALGVTRAALYYYFDTKQALLEEICARSMDTVEAALQEVQDVPDAGERLRAFARQLALNSGTDAARVFFRDAKELRPEVRAKLRDRAHRITRGAEEILEGGIAAGQFRPIDVRIAAPALLATLNSLPDWVRPDRHGTLLDVTDHVLDVYLEGIFAATDGRGSAGGCRGATTRRRRPAGG
jgi:AcrR family transcriptional regulator